jgi:hypothetical protein
MKQKTKQDLNFIYEVYIFAAIISINIFFFVFVHNKYDLSPNFALLFTTLPILIIQLFKIIKYMTK